jgi:hypothetical protein
MDDINLHLEDQQAHVTASAIVRISEGSIALCLFSPDGGECEVFLRASDALLVANALKKAALVVAGG